jgi:hypothetical protein
MESLLDQMEEPKKKERALKTHELMALLRARYPTGEYAFFTEVPNGTGSGCSRHADALAMSLWPSRGLSLYGFELKASRTDWLKELKNPEKAESIARYCDFWFLVAGSKEIVQAGELPPTWGLLVPHGDKLKVAVEAKPMEPEELTRKFIAALLHCASTQIGPDAQIEKIKREEYARGKKDAEFYTQQHIRRLEEKIEGFEKASGVRLTSYNHGSLVEAMKLVERGAVGDVQATLNAMRKQAERIIQVIDKTQE